MILVAFPLSLDVNAARRASYDVASTKAESCNAPITRSASYSVTETSTKVQDALLTVTFILEKDEVDASQSWREPLCKLYLLI